MPKTRGGDLCLVGCWVVVMAVVAARAWWLWGGWMLRGERTGRTW